MQPRAAGIQGLPRLAQELAKLPNQLIIEGHTDAKPFGGRTGYTNWELSTDRANSARRLMETHDVKPGQIVQVRGFADQNLRNPEYPEDASNRRVSVIVRYQNVTEPEDAPAKTGGGQAPAKPPAKAPAKP